MFLYVLIVNPSWSYHIVLETIGSPHLANRSEVAKCTTTT